MRQRNTNTEHVEGRIYQHDLSIKTVQNTSSANYGKQFISGTIDVATDEEALNVLSVHFTYVTELTKSGAKNLTYTALQKIITEGKTWIADGKDAATKIKIDTSLALNDFYGQDNTLVSVKTNEGGFVTIVNELGDDRNKFTMDMVITKTMPVEPQDENEERYLTLQGIVFNFRNDALPVEFVVRNKAGIKYFEDLEISNAEPIFTKVWGRIVSTTAVTQTVEESAFGESAVHSYEKKTKEWVVTGTAKVPYDFGDPTVITRDDLTTAMQNRQIYLAEIKQRKDEYEASKAASAATPTGFEGAAMNIPNAQTATFNF